jgi:hypothetical protein
MNLQTWVGVDEIGSRFKNIEPVLGDYDLDTSEYTGEANSHFDCKAGYDS